MGPLVAIRAVLAVVHGAVLVGEEIAAGIRRRRERRRSERCPACDGRPAVSCPVCGTSKEAT